jgi:DNA-binding CsgD family transcriptional regulator
VSVKIALVEREEASGALREVVNEAVAGRGAVAIVFGPTGIGQTSLLDALDSSVAEVRVLRARCSIFERDCPIGIVRQLIAGLDGSAVDTLLDSSGVGVTAALAEQRPLVVVVDDIHRADEASWYISAELAAADGSARVRGRHVPESLTPSERRIAALAAAGHTNREIAEQLFVTVKNVEGHLTRAFRKLGISSRRQLRQFEL